jgi:hypothetical protein
LGVHKCSNRALAALLATADNVRAVKCSFRATAGALERVLRRNLPERMDAAASEAIELVMVARRLIALTVAYAIGLHALLSGFAVPAGRATEICVPAGNAARAMPPAPAAPHHPLGSDCLACSTMCGAGLPPAPGALMVGLTRGPSAESRLSQVVVRAPPRLLPPSRAPPAA